MHMEVLFAQSQAVELGWGAVTANLGVAAILGWYLWYTQTVSFPRLSEYHLQRLDSICANHDKALQEAISEFSQVMREERTVHREELEIIRQSLLVKQER